MFLHKLSTRVVCVDRKHPRCQVYVYLPFSEESFNVQRKRFHVWAIAYSEKTALKKLYADGQKLSPMDYSNFYMVSEFVRVNWKTCQLFPWQGERFVRFPHLQLPKETYFIGVRVKEGGGGGGRKFSSLSLLASLPVSYPTHFDLLQRLDFFGIDHGGYSSRNIRRVYGRVFLSKLLSSPLPTQQTAPASPRMRYSFDRGNNIGINWVN